MKAKKIRKSVHKNQCDCGFSIKSLALAAVNCQNKIQTSQREKPVEETEDRCYQNKGRPKKTTPHDERNVVRALHGLQKKSASFSSKRIQEEASLSQTTSNKTVRRVLRRHGYKYVQTRKKGFLTEPTEFWTKDINVYFDVVRFTHKFHPCSEARATSSMAWQLPKEGIQRTTKGR